MPTGKSNIKMDGKGYSVERKQSGSEYLFLVSVSDVIDDFSYMNSINGLTQDLNPDATVGFLVENQRNEPIMTPKAIVGIFNMLKQKKVTRVFHAVVRDKTFYDYGNYDEQTYLGGKLGGSYGFKLEIERFDDTVDAHNWMSSRLSMSI